MELWKQEVHQARNQASKRAERKSGSLNDLFEQTKQKSKNKATKDGRKKENSSVENKLQEYFQVTKERFQPSCKNACLKKESKRTSKLKRARN